MAGEGERAGWWDRPAKMASPWLWSKRSILAFGVVLYSVSIAAVIWPLVQSDSPWITRLVVSAITGLFVVFVLLRPYGKSLTLWRRLNRHART